jgi:hypothetical protein
MIRLILFYFPLILLSSKAFNQNIDSITLSKLKLNFTVPDMPAFKSLGVEPSNLLKPSTPQALAVTMSELYQNRKFLLPEAFALEISPSLLISSNKGPVLLKQYAKRAVINSLRVSVGTSSDTLLSPSGRSLAVGLRISIINKGDLATDTFAQNKISELLKKFRENVSLNSKFKFAALRNIDTKVVDWDSVLASGGSLKKEFDEYLANEQEESQKIFLRDLQKMKDNYKKENWNATKLDFAVSILSSSPDSLIKNIRFNKADMWLTWANRAGKNGQFLFGFNAQNSKKLLDTIKANQNKSYFNVSIPVRYLLGTNRIKGFAEAQYSYKGEFKEQEYLLNLGADLNIIDGIWINLYGGFKYNTSVNSARFITNLDIKLNLPENFKFF